MQMNAYFHGNTVVVYNIKDNIIISENTQMQVIVIILITIMIIILG